MHKNIDLKFQFFNPSMPNTSKTNEGLNTKCCQDQSKSCDSNNKDCCTVKSRCKCNMEEIKNSIKEEIQHAIETQPIIEEMKESALLTKDVNVKIENEVEEVKNEVKEIKEKVEEIKGEVRKETPLITKEDTNIKVTEDEKSPFLAGNYSSNVIEQPIELKDDEYEEEQLNKLDKIFGAQCTMYRYDPVKLKYEERGVGKIYIVSVAETNLYKIMMVRSKVKRLGCNHYVSPLTPLQPHDKCKNAWLWTTLNDTCEGDSKLSSKQTLCVRFTSSDDSKLFEMKFKYAQDHNEKNIKIKSTID